MYFIIILVVVIYFYIDKRKYDNSLYKNESGLPYIKAKFNIGYHGEYLCFEKLELLNGYHKILVNVYVPKEDNQTTEIDLVYIHETGIYVLESKNYSGWIFGNEKSKSWRQTLKNGRKKQFYNPIWQNNTHIKYLSKVLGDIDTKYFKSIIVFSERCKLKNVEVYSENIKVIKRDKLISVLQEIIDKSDRINDQNKIIEIYNRLKSLSNVSEVVKIQHINNIKAHINQ